MEGPMLDSLVQGLLLKTENCVLEAVQFLIFICEGHYARIQCEDESTLMQSLLLEN